MYWITEPVLGGYAEKEDGTLVESLYVFSSREAANHVRHNSGSVRLSRRVSKQDLAELIETSAIGHEFGWVVVNPVPVIPASPCPEDVRPLTMFLEGPRAPA